MTDFESPNDFLPSKRTENIEFAYSRMLEVVQGGPVLGNLSINGNLIPKYRFGGPALIDDQVVYAPVFMRRLFNTGFKISRIHVPSMAIELIGRLKPVICLDKVEEENLYYYEDMKKTVLSYISITH